RTAGMQTAVATMRRAGYRGVIAIPGIDRANDLSAWLANRPRDPLGQLVAEAHVYGKNTCDAPACLQAGYAPVARRVPLILDGMLLEQLDAPLRERARDLREAVDGERDVVQPARPAVERGKPAAVGHDELDRAAAVADREDARGGVGLDEAAIRLLEAQ